jgi:glycosyltransferase involved in cell wall biosynthesis
LRSLQRRGEKVTSIATQRPLPIRAGLAMMYRPTSLPWKYSRLNQRLAARALRVQATAAGCQAVISTADESFDAGVPTFVYQDMNFEVARAAAEVLDVGLLTVLPTSRPRLEELAERQSKQYESLSGVFAMSQWFRKELIAQGIRSTSVEVVGAGLTSVPSGLAMRDEPKERTRLLFIGGDFARKGGDLVLGAVERLRRDGDRPLTLTVVGPRSWPEQGEPPDWVQFLGHVPPAVVAPLFANHDLFVMPSRFEAYGIAVLEAQAAGIPCIVRRAFAMPELVPEGRGGLLIEADGGVDELATAIAAALDDDELYEHIGDRAAEVRKTHSWDGVAEQMVSAIKDRVAT